MKNLFIILIALLLTSCMTLDRVSKNCDLFMKVCEVPVKKEVKIVTNTVTEIKYRDTVIYVDIPGKTVIQKVPVYINKGIVNSELSVLTVPFAESTAQVVRSKLIHDLTQIDTVLLFKLRNALKTVITLEKENKTLSEKVIIPIKENKPFAKFTIKWFIGSLFVIVLFLGYLVLRFKSKLLSLFRAR